MRGFLSVATANEIAGDKFRIGVHRNPCPNVASTFRRGLRRRDVLLLRVNESPRLIDLYALGGEIANVLIVVGHADVAHVRQELGD